MHRSSMYIFIEVQKFHNALWPSDTDPYPMLFQAVWSFFANNKCGLSYPNVFLEIRYSRPSPLSGIFELYAKWPSSFPRPNINERHFAGADSPKPQGLFHDKINIWRGASMNSKPVFFLLFSSLIADSPDPGEPREMLWVVGQLLRRRRGIDQAYWEVVASIEDCPWCLRLRVVGFVFLCLIAVVLWFFFLCNGLLIRIWSCYGNW